MLIVKNIFFTILIIFSLSIFSQTATLMKTYSLSTPVGGGGMHIRSVILNNCLYNTYFESGISIQKNDLNGIPILKKIISINMPNPSTLFMSASGSNIYISGTRTAMGGMFIIWRPFLIVLDTASLNLVYSKDYTVAPGFDRVIIEESKVLNNGQLLMCGSVGNFGGPNPEYGFFMGVNIASGGNIAYTRTLQVESYLVNIINSFSEISNSSIIFSAGSGSAEFLGKAEHVFNNLSFTSINLMNPVAGKVESFSNSKKVLVYSPQIVYKIDTSLNVSTMATSFSTAMCTYYKNDRLYRFINGAKLEIIDTSLNVVSANSYSSVVAYPPTYTPTISRNNSHLFINFCNEFNTANFYLIKTNLMGQTYCSSSYTTSSGLFPITTSTRSFSSGNPIGTTTTNILSTTINNLSFIDDCLALGLNDAIKVDKLNVFNTNGAYHIESHNLICKIEIYDINAKIIKSENFELGTTSIYFDISVFPKGLYVVRIMDLKGTEYKVKLLY